MMSRLAVLIAVCQLGFCCGDAQCSTALGSCHSPQASLMQVKSMGQKGKVAAGADTRSETLSGFQRYADELVNQYLKSGEPLSSDVKEAIGTIIAFIDKMYTDLLLFHTQDVEEAKGFKGSVDHCNTSFWEDTFVTNLKALKARKDAAGKDHLECREWLRDTCPGQKFDPADWSTGPDHEVFTAHDAEHDALFGEHNSLIQQASTVALGETPINDELQPGVDHCQVYDDYRQKNSAALLTSAPQNCAPAHLQDNYIQAEGQPLLGEMEECLENVKLWLDPLYEKMMACDRQTEDCKNKPKECKTHQRNFEYETCEYNTMVNIKCSGYKSCFDGVLAASVSTCGTIEIRAAARQADNETAERIKCLLGVLMVDDDATKVEEEGGESKADKLTACKSRTAKYEEYNEFWEIPCPVWGEGGTPNEEYPPGVDCMADRLSPCNEAFLEEEYTSKADYLNLYDEQTLETELNTQFGQCTQCPR